MKTEYIINLIQQLYCAGVTRTELAYGFGVSVETIRRYSLGLIPLRKQNAFINFIKTNYKEVFDNVAEE